MTTTPRSANNPVAATPVAGAAVCTARQLIEAGATQLEEAGVSFGHGTNNAWDEAAWLVLWSLGLPLDTDLDDPASAANRPLRQEQQAQCATLLRARCESRQPAAYLTGEAWLQGVPFYSDPRSIVPRSLIAELLVGGTLDSWLPTQTTRALDLCTGNGSLTILSALVYPSLQVDGTDISSEALALAQRNVARHQLEHRIRLWQSDGLRAVHDRYHLVLCNPPYVNANSMAALPPEFRAEPALALAGGDDGMDFIRVLLTEVAAFLEPNGVLVLEIGHERGHFEAAFPHLQPVWLTTSAGDDQVLLLTRESLV